MRSLHHPTRLRAAAWAVLALAVLLGHGLLWQALRPAPAPPGQQAAHRPVPQRVLQLLESPAPAARPEPLPAAVAVAPPRRALPPAAPGAAMAAIALMPPIAPVGPMAAIAQAVPMTDMSALPAPAAATPALADSAELPVYATRLPDPARLHYRLQRGASVGVGTLDWQHGDAGYALRLDVQWPGQPAQGSASRGQIDADGVAPLRHAELKRAREQRAVNFQREAATITFSGPQAAYALPPGAQDRLSWMIQLPAIVQADAALARAGAVVTLFVAGTRGDAQAWRFEVLGHQTLELPAGTVAGALQLRREPTRPYDTRVEVWLDPARQHLPVRAVLTTLPGGQPLQLELAAPDSGLEIDAAAPR